MNEEQCYADFVRKCLEAGIDPTKGKRNSDVKREESVPLVKLEYALPLLNPIGVAPKMHQKFGMKKQKRRNKKRKNAFEEKSAKKRNRLNDGFATTTDLTWFPPAKDERIAVNEPNYIYYHCQTNVHVPLTFFFYAGIYRKTQPECFFPYYDFRYSIALTLKRPANVWKFLSQSQ